MKRMALIYAIVDILNATNFKKVAIDIIKKACLTNIVRQAFLLFIDREDYFPLLASCPQAASMSLPRLLLTLTFTLFFAR